MPESHHNHDAAPASRVDTTSSFSSPAVIGGGNSGSSSSSSSQQSHVSGDELLCDTLVPCEVVGAGQGAQPRRTRLRVRATLSREPPRSFRLEVTDPDDPSELHTCAVTPASFAGLRDAQGVRVDYAAFPGWVMSLVAKCAEGGGAAPIDGARAASHGGAAPMTPTTPASSSPVSGGSPAESGQSVSASFATVQHNPQRGAQHGAPGAASPASSAFLAVLTLSAAGATPGAVAELALVEANPFRHLPHLTLPVTRATEVSLRRHLCARVRDAEQALRESRDGAECDAASMRAALAAVSAERDQAKSEYEALKASHDGDVLSLRELHNDELARVRTELTRDAARASEAAEAERTRVASEHRSAEADLRARLDAVTAERDRLAERARALESRAESAEHEARRRGEAAERAEADLYRARTALEERVAEVEALRAEAHERRVHVAALEQNVRDKEDLVERMQSLVGTTEEQKRTLEDSVDLLCDAKERLEGKVRASVAQIHRGNDIITRLQEDIRVLREKGKLKTTIAERQDAVIAERDAEIAALRERVRSSEADRNAGDQIVATLETRLEESGAKIEELRAELTKSQNVIHYLNNSATEARLSQSQSQSRIAAGLSAHHTSLYARQGYDAASATGGRNGSTRAGSATAFLSNVNTFNNNNGSSGGNNNNNNISSGSSKTRNGAVSDNGTVESTSTAGNIYGDRFRIRSAYAHGNNNNNNNNNTVLGLGSAGHGSNGISLGSAFQAHVDDDVGNVTAPPAYRPSEGSRGPLSPSAVGTRPRKQQKEDQHLNAVDAIAAVTGGAAAQRKKPTVQSVVENIPPKTVASVPSMDNGPLSAKYLSP